MFRPQKKKKISGLKASKHLHLHGLTLPWFWPLPVPVCPVGGDVVSHKRDRWPGSNYGDDCAIMMLTKYFDAISVMIMIMIFTVV